MMIYIFSKDKCAYIVIVLCEYFIRSGQVRGYVRSDQWSSILWEQIKNKI